MANHPSVNSALGNTPANWYVFVQNQAYGPYTDLQMQSFVAEGRITANSLISNSPNGGFQPAFQCQQFTNWNAGVQISGQEIVERPASMSQASISQASMSQAITPISQTQHRNTTSPNIAPSSVYMIIAEIRSNGEMAFLQSLQSFGQAQRISDSNWLVRSNHSAEQIRNHLSQTLTRQDRLFVVDTKTAKAVWFNIGADLDHRIRELFDEENG